MATKPLNPTVYSVPPDNAKFANMRIYLGSILMERKVYCYLSNHFYFFKLTKF